MTRRLPFTEFDVAGIMNAVNRYKSAGLWADYDPRDQAQGLVRILFEDPIRRDGSFVASDVHKITRQGWFGDKAHWVVQLWSRDPTGSSRGGAAL